MNWEYLKKKWDERKEFLNNARRYVKLIKEICVKKVDSECRVILFGSVARGNYRDDSDVDVLIITDKAESIWDKVNIEVIIERELNIGDPFEFHIVTNSEYENWYKKFIDVYEEF
ncbi:nucleotidyltransferase domain-containing protein [Saccharolobus islandicus]|uniref:DNA polymerase beta subunit domain protein n=1 Tax=Saccharolobus islandicus (strain REY15A) TaxID=930945 RepID=F0NEK3_SACI5|nr:nucleotidyltransferase domain-containing protein [Sulfolobus islandicus]ADX84986.1 DNA polymerase beta subunit domain protein [Sulfolobus islandicus REY15A]